MNIVSGDQKHQGKSVSKRFYSETRRGCEEVVNTALLSLHLIPPRAARYTNQVILFTAYPHRDRGTCNNSDTWNAITEKAIAIATLHENQNYLIGYKDRFLRKHIK